MAATIINGSLVSHGGFRRNVMVGCFLDAKKTLLPDCVLDTERGRKTLSDILRESRSCFGASNVTVTREDVSRDGISRKASGNPDDDLYVTMNLPSAVTSSECPSTVTSSGFKLPRELEEALPGLFPLDVGEELSPAAGYPDEEDRPLAGLCAALLGRAVRDGLGRAYVRGVLAVARTVARAFHPAVLTWRDPRSGLDLLELALRQRHAPTLVQLRNFSEELRDRLVDVEGKLSHRRASPVGQATNCKLPDKCRKAESCWRTSQEAKTTIDQLAACPGEGNLLDRLKVTCAKHGCTKRSLLPWQQYDAMAQHLISLEHQQCNINQNQCPLLRPCSSRSFGHLRSSTDSSQYGSDSSPNQHGDPQDSASGEGLLGIDHQARPPSSKDFNDPRENRGTRTPTDDVVSRNNAQNEANNIEGLIPYDFAEESERPVSRWTSEKNAGTSHSLGEVKDMEAAHQASSGSPADLDMTRDISGSSSPGADQPSPWEHRPQHPVLTTASVLNGWRAANTPRLSPRPRGILRLRGRKCIRPPRSVTFSADTKRGPSENTGHEEDLFPTNRLRRISTKVSLNICCDSFDEKEVVVDSKGVTDNDDQFETSQVDRSFNDSVYEVSRSKRDTYTGIPDRCVTGHMEYVTRSDSPDDGVTDCVVSKSDVPPRPSLDQATNTPWNTSNDVFECPCLGCYPSNSIKLHRSNAEKGPKLNCAALKMFEVRNTSFNKFTSLSAFLSRKAGEAKRFVTKTRSSKSALQRSASEKPCPSSDEGGFNAKYVQDQTIDEAFVDQRNSHKSYSSAHSERKSESEVVDSKTCDAHGRRFLPGQTGWRYTDGCYAFANPAFSDSASSFQGDHSGNVSGKGCGHISVRASRFQQTETPGYARSMEDLSGSSASVYETLDDTLEAVDEMIRDSVGQISLLNMSGTGPSKRDRFPDSPLRREVPGMESFLQVTEKPTARTSNSPTTESCLGIASSLALPATDSAASMGTSVGSSARKQGDGSDLDVCDLSSKTRPAPTGLSVDSPFHVACYFGSTNVAAHLARTRDLDLDLGLSGAVTVAGNSRDGGGSFRHGMPTSRTHTVVGTPLGLCEMGGHPEIASMLLELRAAA